MLEIYFNEIIASVAILILIVIYFIIKKSQQKEKNELNKSKQKAKEEIKNSTSKESNVEGDIVEKSDKKENNNTPKEASKTTSKIKRIKKDIPPHGKITKENFKEFAGQRIVVAEDNIINQKVINGLLVDSGIDVVIADDGQFLLEILEKDSNFNFIFMDAHMPRMDGFEATRKIRENSKYNHIVIIALSGDTAIDDINKMTEAGMEEHLEKPLKIEAMYELLYAYSNSIQTTSKELDTDAGLNISAYDAEFYQEILNEFLSRYSDSTEKLQEYINKKEILKADRYLLDISGITANIGANNLSKIALKLKEVLVNIEDKKYMGLLKDYEISIHNLLKEIKKYKG
nr:response regulator [uncultured Sulfurimonas sp.]